MVEVYEISGICDATNTYVGTKTACENTVCATDEVISTAKTILASNSFAYDGLLMSNYDGKLIDFQQYMMLG